MEGLAERVAGAAWRGYWRNLGRYHRYQVEGLERLLQPGAALLVGYHGRPFAYDLLMLQALLHQRLGYMPHAIGHRVLQENRKVASLMASLGVVPGEGPELKAAIDRGEHILVTPGGTPEGTRTLLQRYRVHWADRVGYLRLALRHRLPIIPGAAAGVDDAYQGLHGGKKLGKLLHLPGGLPLWLGVGPAGLWPFSPPFPVHIRQFIGEPIHLEADGKVDLGDKSRLLELHQKVRQAVQALLDKAVGR